jgi:hypothetical protein
MVITIPLGQRDADKAVETFANLELPVKVTVLDSDSVFQDVQIEYEESGLFGLAAVVELVQTMVRLDPA